MRGGRKTPGRQKKEKPWAIGNVDREVKELAETKGNTREKNIYPRAPDKKKSSKKVTSERESGASQRREKPAWAGPLPRVVEKRVNPHPRARTQEGSADREEV